RSGIISAASVNKFTLNQGKLAKEFKVDEDTVFVTGRESSEIQKVVNWDTLVNSNDTYYYGSFVRVLADEDGVVSHIVQLGNPEELAIDGEGWRTVAEKTVETKGDNTAAIEEVKDVKDYDILKIEGRSLRLSQNTNYYVADYKNGNLTKVADLDEAKDLLADDQKIERVYAGYNVLPNSKVE